jgi:acyl-CoA dehydrogenase
MNKLLKTALGIGAVAALFEIPAIRRNTLSKGVMQAMDTFGFLPTISDTEKEAIEAGSVWMDGELFSGNPDFRTLARQPYPELTDEERAFLDGPVEELCRMTDDYEVHQRQDLSQEVWDFIVENKFFGMIIPKEYGGLGFSSTMVSEVVQKLATRSITLSITVMVPNSLGPAELLIEHGTEEQKEHYLPKLATAEEIPAFALTEPGAGSDAGAMESRGEIFEGNDGELYLRLNWTKRYITLAAISTTLGLAFKCFDPENHLGKGEELGITAALVSTDKEGVVLGKRHDPLDTPFINCPTEGHDVVVPLDAVIGGKEQIGRGWRLLMECLSAGRGVTMPAQATGGIKYAARVASGHATVRQQFGLPIGKFEGIEEPLARMGGYTYMMDAARKYTTGAVDQGEKPSVVSAIMKYNSTERQRESVNDAMDVLGGNGIVQGPNNLLAAGYKALPISITVEGANILTRTLMIFGQGAIRCHPYAFEEIEALENKDLEAFDRAFAGHVEHILGNFSRSVLYSLTRGKIAPSPVRGPSAPYYRKLAWASARFAILADVAMGSLGGALKRKEKLTGRFADVFSHLYIGVATLRRFEAEGRREEDEPIMHWAMQHCLSEIQEGFDGLYENLKVPGLTWLFRGPLAWWSRLNPISSRPSDDLGGEVAERLQQDSPQRDRLTSGVFLPDAEDEPMRDLERAFELTLATYDTTRAIRDAVKSGKIEMTEDEEELVERAVEQGVVSREEGNRLKEAEAARERYIAVDAFTLEEMGEGNVGPQRKDAASERKLHRGDGAPAGDGSADVETDATKAG